MGIWGRVNGGRALTGVDGGSPPYREGIVSRETIYLFIQILNNLFRMCIINVGLLFRLNLKQIGTKNKIAFFFVFFAKYFVNPK